MNIVYLHTHDSGRIISPYGYKVPTPNLEAFAKEAVVFRNCFCAGPTCSPSRAAMLTGTYPHQNGMLGLAQRGFKLDYEKHLVRYLNSHDYHTVLCGIQHEAGWYLDEGGGRMIGYQEELTADNSGYRQEDLGDWDLDNAGKVCRWLESYRDDQPFFLSYGMYATHRRYPDSISEDIEKDFILPPPPIPDSPETREDFARYMTSSSKADRCVGMILDTLKKLGHMEDTIIFFTTDHGLANPFSKCTLFDSGIGVAFMIRCPAAISQSSQTGRLVDGLISHVDVFPTLCDLLGLEKPDYLEGVSFAPAIRGETDSVRGEIFAEVNFHTSYEPIRCVRTERYKYIRYYDKDYLKINRSNIDESPTKDYFMGHGLEQQIKYEEALYDLIYDMGERNNLAGNPDYEGIKEELAQKLEHHMEATVDPLVNGEIPIDSAWKVNKKECETASSKNPEDYVNLGV